MTMALDWFTYNGVVYDPETAQAFQNMIPSVFERRLIVDPDLEAKWLEEMPKAHATRHRRPMMKPETFNNEYRFAKDDIDEWVMTVTASTEKRELLRNYAYELYTGCWRKDLSEIKQALTEDYKRYGMTKRFH